MNSMTNWGLWHGDYGDPSALPRHLAVEEAPLVPLAGQHLSEAEWARLDEEGVAGVPRTRFGMVRSRIDPQVSVGIHARYARRVHEMATP